MTNDIDELTALNLDFVASAQNSDVRRFDEILAPEFYCSNPDKSLVDRAAFLEQTAKPVAIKNLQAHDVKIRIMGHFAIIHAATSYTTPDGQQAHGRYTDCWAKQNGKWLAVSAHVTRWYAAVIAGHSALKTRVNALMTRQSIANNDFFLVKIDGCPGQARCIRSLGLLGRPSTRGRLGKDWSYCAEPPCRARAAKEPPMKLPRTVGLAVAVSLVAATVAALA
jgi:ketosteroid isomerase-like protein